MGSPDASSDDPQRDALTAERPPRRRLPLWLCLVLGILAALVGLLPWLITGMRLPLQNLWATSTAPGEMPLVLLPFSQYAITLIIGLLVTGAGVAGIAARSLRARMSKAGAASVFVGLAAVQILAVVQTALVVHAGLEERDESQFYLAALLGVSVLSVITGVIVFFLVAVAPRAGAVAGLSIAALAFGPWLSGLIVPLGTVPSAAAVDLVLMTRWVPPVLVGLAIAWGGIGSVGRVVAALFGLLLVWFVPALSTAIGYVAGNRILARDPIEMLAGGEVFLRALTEPAIALPPVIVAVVVATVGLVIRAIVRRTVRSRRASRPLGGAEPERGTP